jgi:hypothetical protein
MLKRTLLILAMLFTVAACSGGGSEGNSVGGDNTVNDSQGGSITVDDTNSPIFGTRVVFKPDTLDSDIETIKIDYENNLPAELPARALEFDPAQASKTLVLTRSGTHDLRQPAEVTLPYDTSLVGVNDVPLVMHWDEESGRYSAVALSAINREAGTVTFRTAHFSKYVVIVLRRVQGSLQNSQQPPVDTGFRADVDGFFVHNFGAYDSPGGSCLGMANYSAWYFDNKKPTKGVGLQTLYKQGEPAAEEDDQDVRELISRAFVASSQYWARDAMATQSAAGEIFTGVYLIQSMLVTGSPQVLLMSDAVPASNLAHAVTVYGYDAVRGQFEIYDNNYPREAIYLPWNPNEGFGSYPKYNNANEFGFDAWHSTFSPATMESLYNGIESGWNASKFARITLTEPAPSVNDDSLLLAEAATDVVLAGFVPRISGEDNPDAARFAHLYLNGINKVGVAPIDDAGDFEFGLGTLPNPDNTDLMILVSESASRWQRGFRAFKQATIRVSDQTDFTLTVNVTGYGSVSSLPAGIDCDSTCRADFSDGSTVVLTASPAIGYVFSSWSGACGGSGAALTCTLSMTEARTVSATFTESGQTGWSIPLPVSAGGAGNPQVVIGEDGQALLVWQQQDQSVLTSSIWASQYAPDSGWTTPVLLETNEGGTRDLHLVMDAASGKAMAIWQQVTGPIGYDVWARSFDPDSGWGNLVAIDNTDGSAGKVAIGMDAGGNAVAVWSQLEAQYSGHISIYANRLSVNSGWGTAELIETENELGRVDGDPSLYVAPSGDAVVVWTGSGGATAGRGIWTNRLTEGAGWSGKSQLVSRQEVGAFALSAPFIAGDATGTALLTFGQMDVTAGQVRNTLYARRYQGGWQSVNAPVTAEFDNGSVVANAYVKVGGVGTALTIWADTNSTRLNASLGSTSGTWGTPTVISNSSRELRSIPSFALDNQGNAFVSWAQGNDQGANDVWIAQYTSGSGWASPEIFDETIEMATDPSLAVNPQGNAVLAWTESAASNIGTRIQVSHYRSGR